MHQNLTDIHNVPCHLWWQTLFSDPCEVLLIPEQMDWEELTVLATDLLARFYIRAGRISEAKILWQKILQIDPGYPLAVKVQYILNSPWFIWAVIRSYSLWFAFAGLFHFALYGLGVLFSMTKDSFFVLVGVITILTVLVINLASLFGGAFVMLMSIFDFSQSTNIYRMNSWQSCESISDSLYTSVQYYWR